MFLLTSEPGRAVTVLTVMAEALGLPDRSVHSVRVGSHTLSWMRAQVRDNLHVHPDGVFVGRRSASEALVDGEIRHDEPLAVDRESVLGGVVIRSSPRLTVEPLGVTNAYWCNDTASDRQLLLAGHHRLAPSHAGVAVMAGIGNFPGNMTLFEEVERIPFLERWDLARRVGARTRSVSVPRADDAAMIDRLVSLVPADASHVLGLSGGYDSRFVLGVLQRANADVRIVRFTDEETDIATSIAHELGIDIHGIGGYSEQEGRRSPSQFTLMTDALIWHGVAQHGRLRTQLAASDVFHSGHFSPSMNKNTFRTVWKKPDPRVPFRERIIQDVFLPNVPAVQPTLRYGALREEVADTIRREIDYQWSYVDFATKKQWANWVYYLNRGMRWAQAYYDDLAYSTNVVYLISDLDAQLLGISSPIWPNLNNDRVARLNRLLLPTVSTPYASGRPAEPATGPRGVWNKLDYEFLQRLRVSRTARKKLLSIPTTYVEDLPAAEPPGFDRIFDRPMAEVATQGKFGLRRANVTVSHVLAFLASIPDTPAGGDGPSGSTPDA